MKKVFALALVVAFAISNHSCSKFVDGYEVSPNSPSEVTAPLLTTALEVSAFNTYTGQLARLTSCLSQSCAGNDFQFVDIANYIILEGDNQNEWDDIYSNSIINANTLYDLAGAENPHYQGIALVMKSMALAVATDLWGNVPNREAGQALAQGEAGYSPSYDEQEVIYSDIQAMLTEAIAAFNKTDNLLAPGEDDLIYGGDAAKWKAAAYVLKARYANRLSLRNPSGSATDALGFVDDAIAAGFSSSDANMNAKFGSAGNELNQWFAFNNNRGGYIKVAENLITMLQGDPRLPFYAMEDDNGGYSGNPVGVVNDPTFSNVGTYLNDIDATELPLVSYAELKFIEAEAAMRGNDAGRAATAFNDAIEAAVTIVAGSDQAVMDFLAANQADAASITMATIMEQKYLAMFGQIEAYNDWRRTGIPTLVPNPNVTISQIPVRLPTPLEERLYNANATVTSDILKPVWWDE